MFEAQFVDFPNCIVIGTSCRQAEERAQRALSIWLGVIGRLSRPLPEPSVVNDRNTPDHYVAYIAAQPAPAEERPLA
jgi:predicted RNase H-like HicB family nuclease